MKSKADGRPQVCTSTYGRAQGCEPAVYTMADIDRFAAMSEFKAWLVAHELAIPKPKEL